MRELRALSQLDEAGPEVVDLHALLDGVLKLVHSPARERIRVVRHYGEIPPVERDAGELHRVFLNLLLNAVQAIAGRGLIAVTTAWEGGRQVVVSIRASGCGIPGEILERIFDPFFTTRPVGQGAGLGLSISREIVKRHRGRLDVRSAPGEGTEVILILPIRLADQVA